MIPSREGNNYISKREAKRNPKFRTKFRTEAKILSPPELREHLTENPSTLLNSAPLGLGGGNKTQVPSRESSLCPSNHYLENKSETLLSVQVCLFLKPSLGLHSQTFGSWSHGRSAKGTSLVWLFGTPQAAFTKDKP